MKKRLVLSAGIGAGIGALGVGGYFLYRRIKKGGEKEEEYEHSFNLLNTDNWETFKKKDLGLKMKLPSGWCTIVKPTEKTHVMVIFFVDPTTTLNGNEETKIIVQSSQRLESAEDSLDQSLSLIKSVTGDFKIHYQKEEEVEGVKFYEVEFSHTLDKHITSNKKKDLMKMYNACAVSGHKTFIFQHLSRTGTLNRNLCKTILSTIHLDQVEEKGTLTYFQDFLSIMLPSVYLEKIETFQSSVILNMGEKYSYDGTCRMKVQLRMDRHHQLEELIEGFEGKETVNVQIFGKEFQCFIYQGEEEATQDYKFFYVPFTLMNQVFVLEYQVKDQNRFDRSSILSSIESLKKTEEKEEKRLFYNNEVNGFSMEVPDVYAIVENIHKEPYLTFTNISSESKGFEIDVASRSSVEKISSIEKLEKVLIGQVNPKDLISSQKKKVDGKDWIEIIYSQSFDGISERFFFMQSSTLRQGEVFYIRTTSTKIDGFSKEEEEIQRKIHNSIVLK